MKILFPLLAIATAATLATSASSQMMSGEVKRAVIDENLVTSIPEGFRHWTFLGAPMTPNGLNGGAAPFPEFHHVYVHPSYLKEYLETGVWPEGTTIVKELVINHEGHYEDGSRDEVSGRGYFAKEFHGIDMMVKDSEKFADTSNWGFYNFGHHAPPYAESAAEMPAENCASCHQDNAHIDMVYSNFYPILSFKE